MKNYKNNDYALNRYSQGIVYRFANQTIEITLEDYLKENQGKSEQDFLQLKAISDEIYYQQDRLENSQTYKNISIHSLEETDKLSIKTPEEEHIKKQEYDFFQQAVEAGLTQKQATRIYLWVYRGLSSRKIAKLEGLHYRSIQDSLLLARSKLKKYFKKK